MTGALEIFFRPVGQDDWHYVLDSWKKSYRESLQFNSPDYYTEMATRIDRLMKSPNTAVTLAVDPDDHEFILGWICNTDQPIHYMFTRQCFRRAHVAKRLVMHRLQTDEPIATTSWTRVCEIVNRKYNGALRYEPTRNRVKKRKRNVRLRHRTDYVA